MKITKCKCSVESQSIVTSGIKTRESEWIKDQMVIRSSGFMLLGIKIQYPKVWHFGLQSPLSWRRMWGFKTKTSLTFCYLSVFSLFNPNMSHRHQDSSSSRTVIETRTLFPLPKASHKTWKGHSLVSLWISLAPFQMNPAIPWKKPCYTERPRRIWKGLVRFPLAVCYHYIIPFAQSHFYMTDHFSWNISKRTGHFPWVFVSKTLIIHKTFD